MKTISISAYYDGVHILLDEPILLERNEKAYGNRFAIERQRERGLVGDVIAKSGSCFR